MGGRERLWAACSWQQGGRLYDWQTTGKRVKVKDPIYHQDHTFEVWQVEIDGQIHRFAAGEFSNCVWGFYLEKN